MSKNRKLEVIEIVFILIGFMLFGMILGAVLFGCSGKSETAPLPTTQCWECTYQGSGPPPPNNIIDSCGLNSNIQSWVITMERQNYECKLKTK